jgi:hypothetical protein
MPSEVEQLYFDAFDPISCLQEMKDYANLWPRCRAGYFACAVTIMCSTQNSSIIRNCEAARRFAKSTCPAWNSPGGRGQAMAYRTAIAQGMFDAGLITQEEF